MPLVLPALMARCPEELPLFFTQALKWGGLSTWSLHWAGLLPHTGGPRQLLILSERKDFSFKNISMNSILG